VAANLCLVEANHGGPVAALNYFALAIRNYHDSGYIHMIHNPLGALAAFLDRLDGREPAATIAGFAAENYESFAHDGETMTSAQMAAFAYDQIDQTRASLSTDSK
jgi:hypothetical protein